MEHKSVWGFNPSLVSVMQIEKGKTGKKRLKKAFLHKKDTRFGA